MATESYIPHFFLQKYLQQYHYISTSRSGNHDFKTAVRNFQHFMGLPETGDVDRATLNMMRKPRCGVPDVEDGSFESRVKGGTTRLVPNGRRHIWHTTYSMDRTFPRQHRKGSSSVPFSIGARCPRWRFRVLAVQTRQTWKWGGFVKKC